MKTDSQLQGDVREALRWEPRVQEAEIEAAFHRHAGLDTRRIRVETHDTTVVLRGHARSWLEREEAERAAWAAPGVTQVENLIRVTP